MKSFLEKVLKEAERYGDETLAVATKLETSVIPGRPVRPVSTIRVTVTQKLEDLKLTNPVAVAGLADSVRNAIAGMARAKQSADGLAASASKLVGNIASVDSIKSQLDAANAELEAAVAEVSGPLPEAESSQAGSPVVEQSPPSGSGVGISAASPAEGIQKSVAQVQAAHQA